MRPGPNSIVQLIIETINLDEKPVAIEEWVQRMIQQQVDNKEEHWNFDPITIEEKTNLWTRGVTRLLHTKYNDFVQRRMQPEFCFNSSSQYLIQGACFIEPGDTDDVKEQKLRRLHLHSYYNSLKEVSPREFEVLCSKVLGLIGVREPKLTPYRGDEGIDFYGLLSFGDLLGHGAIFPVFETSITIWLIGQAKHYKRTKVATPDVRDLVGATNLGRARAFSKSGKYPDMVIRACDPVVMLFFTTGEISEDGWLLCKNAGVIAMDGKMLAAFLADKGVAISKDGDNMIFNEDEFFIWLRE